MSLRSWSLNGCWIWLLRVCLASLDAMGIRGQVRLAARLSKQAFNLGACPLPGLPMSHTLVLRGGVLLPLCCWACDSCQALASATLSSTGFDVQVDHDVYKRRLASDGTPLDEGAMCA